MNREKFPTSLQEAHDDEGRIKDVDVAREMAEAEDPFHKKRFFGIVNPSAEQLQKGENVALETLNAVLQENISNEAAEIEIQKLLPRFEEMQKDLRASSWNYAVRRQPYWDSLLQRAGDPNESNKPGLLDSLAREIESYEEIEMKRNKLK